MMPLSVHSPSSSLRRWCYGCYTSTVRFLTSAWSMVGRSCRATSALEPRVCWLAHAFHLSTRLRVYRVSPRHWLRWSHRSKSVRLRWPPWGLVIGRTGELSLPRCRLTVIGGPPRRRWFSPTIPLPEHEFCSIHTLPFSEAVWFLHGSRRGPLAGPQLTVCSQGEPALLGTGASSLVESASMERSMSLGPSGT